MRAQIDPQSGVSAIIIDGQTRTRGSTFTMTRGDFERVNDAHRRKVLVEVAEVGTAEPENDDEDETVQED